jgi:hypothetical protein
MSLFKMEDLAKSPNVFFHLLNTRSPTKTCCLRARKKDQIDAPFPTLPKSSHAPLHRLGPPHRCPSASLVSPSHDSPPLANHTLNDASLPSCPPVSSRSDGRRGVPTSQALDRLSVKKRGGEACPCFADMLGESSSSGQKHECRMMKKWQNGAYLVQRCALLVGLECCCLGFVIAYSLLVCLEVRMV